jgi:hypothetical protein
MAIISYAKPWVYMLMGHLEEESLCAFWLAIAGSLNATPEAPSTCTPRVLHKKLLP